MDQTTTRTLPVRLTDEEVNTYARHVSEKCLRVQELEDAKAAHAKSIKGLIDGLTSEMRDISIRVKRREEPRDVECHWTYRWIEGIKELVRMDTYEAVETRPIEQHERQQRLKIDAERSSPPFGPAVPVPVAGVLPPADPQEAAPPTMLPTVCRFVGDYPDDEGVPCASDFSTDPPESLCPHYGAEGTCRPARCSPACLHLETTEVDDGPCAEGPANCDIEPAHGEILLVPMKYRAGASQLDAPRCKIGLFFEGDAWRFRLELTCHHAWLTAATRGAPPPLDPQSFHSREWALYTALEQAYELAESAARNPDASKVMRREATRIMESVEAYRAEQLPNSQFFGEPPARPQLDLADRLAVARAAREAGEPEPPETDDEKNDSLQVG